MTQHSAQIKFIVVCSILQVIMAVLFGVFVRYSPTADSAVLENRKDHNNHALNKVLDQYPMVIDIHVMLFAGFALLMTFLKNYGYSALSFTMVITALVTEVGILAFGIIHLEDGHTTFELDFIGVLQGGLAAATTLITFGAIIGKVNLLQLVTATFIETILYTINAYIGYDLFGAVDAGGSIFIHTFGAYYGMAISLALRWRDYNSSTDSQSTNSTSDAFSLLGTILLWLYWPSFNAVLVEGDSRHRAFINTYISLLASTVCTFAVSAIFGSNRRFNVVDIQNATLAGGVIMGASADLMIQPYGAYIAGCIAGVVSTLGYQPFLMDWMNIHDSCGVNNLHGMPGILGSFLSAILCAVATEEEYGLGLYLVFPRMAPVENSPELNDLQDVIPDISPGEGRTPSQQALMQLASLGVTMAISVGGGLLTGFFISIDSVFSNIPDKDLFNDNVFFNFEIDEKEEEEVQELSTTTITEDIADVGDVNVSRKFSVNPQYQQQFNNPDRKLSKSSVGGHSHVPGSMDLQEEDEEYAYNGYNNQGYNGHYA